jgi:ligand-binding sensor domain-containing protein
VVEDPSGTIWIQTYRDAWLDGFDGYGTGLSLGGVTCLSRLRGGIVTTLGPEDGVPQNGQPGILVDRSGNLWMGTESSIARFDGNQWHEVAPPTELPLATAMPKLEARDGGIWITAGNGFAFRYLDGSWIKYQVISGAGAAARVMDIVESGDGAIYFCSSGNSGTGRAGITRLENGQLIDRTPPNYPPTMIYLRMTSDAHGDIWAGAQGHYARFNGLRWRLYSLDPLPFLVDGWPPRPIRFDRDGALWIGDEGRCVRWDRSEIVMNPAPYYTQGSIDNTVEDHRGDFWFATYRDGVVRQVADTLWQRFSRAEGLYAVGINDMTADSSGNLWLMHGNGVSKYDGATWSAMGSPDPDWANSIKCAVDRDGGLWIGGYGGVRRLHGGAWTRYMYDAGFPLAYVGWITPDRSGNIWVGDGDVNVARFDGTSWQAYTFDAYVWSVYEDRAGNWWFGTYRGARRFDGTSWTTYTTADGLADDRVTRVLEDRMGRLWFSTAAGVSMFDGATWRTFGPNERYPAENCYGQLVDHSGTLWFSTDRIWYRVDPDYVPPRTRFALKPPIVTGSGDLSATVVAAYEELDGIEFSFRFDGGAWSEWTPNGSWSISGVPDGTHVLEARTRDFSGNIDPDPARAELVVDATPPSPVIVHPPFGVPVRGIVEVIGTTADTRFLRSRLEVKPSAAASWANGAIVSDPSSPELAGTIGFWDTRTLPDGSYDLRLTATDSLGLVGTAITTVVVDNHAPFFDETAPAKVTAAAGGDVFTTNAETHLYFPPHAFGQDAVVMVAAVDPGSVPATLPGGAAKVLDGYELAWTGDLRKPARFTLSYAGASLPPGTLALYHSPDGSAWERLGGTVDEKDPTISLAVSAPGRYALYADDGLGAGTASLSAIAFTPRVFAPTGTFADRQVGISFRLGKPAPVTVKVFSKSGRLIREVASGVPLQAGENLISWDGVDRNGGYVVDGVYLVTVEALGQIQTKTLAVVK